MLIKDYKGKYELKLDIERAIVYEKHIGLWDYEDICRFHNEYLFKIIPMLKGREWFKCTDLREYEFSNITDEITQHITWCVENNLFGAIMIVKNELITMQMNVSVINTGMIYSPVAFCDVKKAEEWLNSHWL